MSHFGGNLLPAAVLAPAVAICLKSLMVAVAAVAVLSICVDAVKMRLLWLSIICFVLFMQL